MRRAVRGRPASVGALATVWFLMAALNAVLGLGLVAGADAVVAFYAQALGGPAPEALALAGAAVLVLGLLQLAAGCALWLLSDGAWTAAVVAALLGLLHFPVGTILATVVLLHLLQPEVRAAYRPAGEPVAE